MVVDFELARSPAYRVVSIAWKGPWDERRIRARFEELERWARARHLRTGRWIFREPGTRRWEVAIEVKGPVRGTGRVRPKTYPASRVARVVFDPEQVSPRVVYHGLIDWLRWRRRDGKIRAVGTNREIYTGNPWRDARAWSRTEVQFLVR